MRTALIGLVSTLALASSLSAGPLQSDVVSADAKWLLHLDLEGFRGTQLGNVLFSKLIDAKLAKPLADLKANFSIELDPKKILSVTAYGKNFQKQPEADAVLAVKSGMKLGELLEDLLNRQTNLTKNTAGPLKKWQQNPFPLFSIKEDMFMAPHGSGWLFLAKSRPVLEQAVQVALGKSKNLQAGRAFADFPALPNTFFFLGVAEGFSASDTPAVSSDSTNAPGSLAAALPPQARVLQMADGGRVALGEKADKVFLDVALKAKTPEGAAQIQQVVQGMIALVTLSKANDPNFRMPPINLTANGRVLALTVDCPTADVLKLMAEKNPELKTEVESKTK